MDHLKLCIFCGAAEGNRPLYRQMAEQVTSLMRSHRVSLVYGGASIGLMGMLANSLLQQEGQVFGVIPRFMQERELAHPGLTEMILVNSMHERKAKMYDLSQGFLAMPGGWGTMDELFEIATWSQLGHHQKPIGIYNENGFYDALIAQMDHMEEEGFLKSETRQMIKIIKSEQELISFFQLMAKMA